MALIEGPQVRQLSIGSFESGEMCTWNAEVEAGVLEYLEYFELPAHFCIIRGQAR